jgi:hypothetical protein
MFITGKLFIFVRSRSGHSNRFENFKTALNNKVGLYA